MALEPGKRLAHYEILSQLGKGGMGEVYRARDTKLKRDVALKTLPDDMASDSMRLKRFQREAEIVAGLNHPHIVTLFSVEEDAEVHFLTMELIEGESLDRLLKDGNLPLSKVIDIGIAVAEALSVAHEKGIVHRDLKPANVMMAKDGRVKVLDFGLAKPTQNEGADDDGATQDLRLTQDGAVLGTLAYMSPEQLSGQALDHRSDIFSLGVMLFELVTGQLPFQGGLNAEISPDDLRAGSRGTEAPGPNITAGFAEVLVGCLEAKADNRHQSATDLRDKLDDLKHATLPEANLTGATVSLAPAPRHDRGNRRWFGIGGALVLIALLAFLFTRGDLALKPGDASVATVADDNSIAVLAFVNMSGDADNEYFSDGISEELLNLLAKIPELRVISRSSAFSFKGQNLEIPEIARHLNVAHVLEGSVRKAGNTVRITAQLIDARSDSHLWSETYDRTLDDIFAIQDEIAQAVVEELKVTLLGAAPRVAKTDPEAYALYLQARHLGGSLTADNLEHSIELFNQVLEIDPSYAAAWDGLAASYLNQLNNGLRPTGEGYALAREAAEKALVSDPGYAPAHESLCWIALWHDNNLAAAARHSEQALALDPGHIGIIRSAATVLIHLGRLQEAINFGEFVTSRDPVAATGHTNLGHAYLYAGRWREAARSYGTALRLSPNDIGGRYNLGLALLFDGQAEHALSEFERESDEEWRVKGQALALFALGRKDEFTAKLAELIDGWGEGWPSEIAHVFAYIGDADACFSWLDKAVAENEAGLTEQFLLPFFGRVHDDPRWEAFLAKVGSSPEQLNSIDFDVVLPSVPSTPQFHTGRRPGV